LGWLFFLTAHKGSKIRAVHLMEKDWFNVCEYKKLPNQVRGNKTCSPKQVIEKMKEFLKGITFVPQNLNRIKLSIKPMKDNLFLT
jgi:hypothetical protein